MPVRLPHVHVVGGPFDGLHWLEPVLYQTSVVDFVENAWLCGAVPLVFEVHL